MTAVMYYVVGHIMLLKSKNSYHTAVKISINTLMYIYTCMISFLTNFLCIHETLNINTTLNISIMYIYSEVTLCGALDDHVSFLVSYITLKQMINFMDDEGSIVYDTSR